MEIFIITVPTNSEDEKLFKNVVNQGIDSRLTAFTKSKFTYKELGTRLYLYFHPNEIEILLRRLDKIADNGNENAFLWESDIISNFYDKEIQNL